MTRTRRWLAVITLVTGIAAVVAVVRRRRLDAATADFERRYGPT